MATSEKAEKAEKPEKPEKAEKAAVRRLRERGEVEKALEQSAPGEEERRPDSRRPKVWLIATTVVAAALGIFEWLVDSGRFKLPGSPFGILPRVPLALFLIAAALVIEKLAETFGVRQISSRVSRYNLTRVLRLVVAVLILGIIAAVIFSNLYAGLVSLGVISLIVGLAVQTPMTSFIGWLYILVRAPYRVGDRIQIDGATGDVIEVSYLDTTLWEFGGKYLSTDHPSGRIIKFPNSKALSTTVYNYSWPLFPYIWNEVRFQIAYQSDLEFVGCVMQQVAEEEVGSEMMKHVRVYRASSRGLRSISSPSRETGRRFPRQRQYLDRGGRALSRGPQARRARKDGAGEKTAREVKRRSGQGDVPEGRQPLRQARPCGRLPDRIVG